MAEAREPPAEPKGVPIADGSPARPAPCGGEPEATAPSGTAQEVVNDEPDAVPIASVSRRFGVGHLLVAVGLFAVLFCFLRLLGAPPFAYVPCALFCVAIPLGQMFLYQGRQPRRASCLVGARLLPLLFICGLAVFLFQDLVDELRYGRVDGKSVAGFVTAMLTLVIVFTAWGYLLGYVIGTVSAGVFLVVDGRWNAGKRAVRGLKGAGAGGASVTATSQIPPTGKWWFDWLAWSPVQWFWQNQRRPVRIAIVLTVLIAAFYLLGVPYFAGGRFQQAYLLGAGVLVPLIGLSLSGVLYAGWRAPLVFFPIGAAVAYPAFRLTHESWAWQHIWQAAFPDVSPAGLAVCTGVVLGLIAAGFYGWIRWTLAGRGEGAGRGALVCRSGRDSSHFSSCSG